VSSWIYRRTGPEVWTVGFYTPAGEFVPESDHSWKAAAAARVRWLNGGSEPPALVVNNRTAAKPLEGFDD
jgi:hypothetical protein